MGKVVALVVVLAAIAGGGAAGYVLRPVPDPDAASADAPPDPGPPLPVTEATYAFRNGFVVPVLRHNRLWSHMVLELGVSAEHVPQSVIARHEPILRDGLTEALFTHGSLGGFDADFTAPAAMNALRLRLNEVVRLHLDDPGARVLIRSMARQDV